MEHVGKFSTCSDRALDKAVIKLSEVSDNCPGWGDHSGSENFSEPTGRGSTAVIAKALEPMEREAARDRYDATRPGVDVKFTPTERGAAMDKGA